VIAIVWSQKRRVAKALVGAREVATIALEKCGRRASGTVGPNRPPVLAGIEQAPVPPSADKQGFRTFTYGAEAAGGGVVSVSQVAIM
jgi:hypothetical protein